MATAVYRVEGMTCEHCVKAVKEEIGAIPGVESVAVDLAAGEVSTVTVTSGAAIDPAAIAAAVDEAGYALTP
ncbi:MAG: cation transporter [Bifidobacteriaceae bacterium]|jgi:copper chaperone CopZ|nr:cation transporter [Bifidobacteriaceae bacterium]